MGVVSLDVLRQMSLMATVLVMTATKVVAWCENKPYDMAGKETVTQIHFYFHDIVGAKNATGVRVAEAPSTNQSATSFGALVIVDDALTEGPELTSKLVGRAQGLYGYVSLEEPVLLMALSYYFIDENFNGSTLTTLTRNPFPDTYREFPIIGGTGLFRYARGVVEAKSHSFNATNGDGIVEYNVTVIHYCSPEMLKNNWGAHATT
ncbi:Plant disease resistance response protein [Macleaya cordata]|uniref:Dirigent protein n=1 Tax=Macleaya cordata TaxID=56857 RepID=A0A200QTS7_MACCD|nr:Plant disease resistance response protein [Macleaya cordata]